MDGDKDISVCCCSLCPRVAALSWVPAMLLHLRCASVAEKSVQSLLTSNYVPYQHLECNHACVGILVMEVSRRCPRMRRASIATAGGLAFRCHAVHSDYVGYLFGRCRACGRHIHRSRHGRPAQQKQSSASCVHEQRHTGAAIWVLSASDGHSSHSSSQRLVHGAMLLLPDGCWFIIA